MSGLGGIVASGAVLAAESRFGATPSDWNHFDMILGLGQDLLSVVSNPSATISPGSKMTSLGKTPSRYNQQGLVEGIKGWTSHVSTPEEITRWSKEPDYGIALQTRSVRAIDVDVTNRELAEEIRAFINERLGVNLPFRYRSNSPKFLLAFRLPGEYGKRVIHVAGGEKIEFLMNGQQFVAAGTHPTGARYEWEGLAAIPALPGEEFEALFNELQSKFGVKEPSKSGFSRRSKDVDLNINDPASSFLRAQSLVLDVNSDGAFLVECPWESEHTTGEVGDGSTVYFPAGTNGKKDPGFKCQHGHCEHRKFRDFLQAVGYVEDLSADFDAVLTLTPEQEREGAAIRYRNEQKAKRHAQAAISKAMFSGGRDALEAARRERQKRENECIGEGEQSIPTAEVVTLEEAVGRFVFLSDGSRVVDLLNPHYDLALADWVATHAASFQSIPQQDKILRGGIVEKVQDMLVPVTKLWRASSSRKTAVCSTFKAGGPLFLLDPAGKLALNSWKPFNRSLVIKDLETAGIRIFLDHIDFLFPGREDGMRFLDWLGHIEQQPGVLPHTAWLHVAKNFGLGRNWLASVIARVWTGSVASNFDLVSTLQSGFNGRLSHKVLAIVDEIREGGRDSHWEHSERLKSLITEESRLINPKYGRQTIEYNACRWLLFSNHQSAIPIEKGDRRIEVVMTESKPNPSDYYIRLYKALDDRTFIAAVATFLAERDIAKFNPGAQAVNTESKQAVVQASQTPLAMACERLLAHWPCDLITSHHLHQVLVGDDQQGFRSKALNAAHRRTLEQFGIEAMGRLVKIGVPLEAVRITILRNKERWKLATPDEIRGELARAKPGMDNASDYLLRLEAEAEEPAVG